MITCQIFPRVNFGLRGRSVESIYKTTAYTAICKQCIAIYLFNLKHIDNYRDLGDSAGLSGTKKFYTNRRPKPDLDSATTCHGIGATLQVESLASS